jgi:hypothetical protein
MASKQSNEPVIGHPKTVAELRQAQRTIGERDRALSKEDADNFLAVQAGTATSRPLTVRGHRAALVDHQKRQFLVRTVIDNTNRVRVI